jgi:peptide/nickel transport system permease protein
LEGKKRKKVVLKKNSPNSKAIKKFKQNYFATFSLFVILLLCFVSLFAYFIAPDHTTAANEQFTVLASKPPAYSIIMMKVKKEDYQKTSFFEKLFNGYERSYNLIPVVFFEEYQEKWVNVQEYRGGDLPTVAYQLSASKLLEPRFKDNFIKKIFYLGTDQLGRDILSRLLVGSRVSLLVGFFAVLISSFIGILAGGFAGFYRGWVDKIILWKMSVFWSIPTILLAMALYVSLKQYFSSNIWLVFLAIGVTMWVSMARIVRGQMMVYREIQFVEAAGSLGYSDFRVIFKHILPNLLGPIVVVMASNFANAILVESGLSFLGLGVQAPAPSWGGMLSEFKDFIGTDLSYLAILPGFLIMVLVLSFNLVGNGVRDALDIKN